MGGPKYQNTTESASAECITFCLPPSYYILHTYFLGATPERLKETTSASGEALRCAVCRKETRGQWPFRPVGRRAMMSMPMTEIKSDLQKLSME